MMTDQKAHFEHLYRTQDDPWGYQTSLYEQAKYAATLAALMQPRYASVLEAGCSIGVLSALLAPRCDHLLALDLSERAVAQATQRLAPHPGARAMRAVLPGDWVPGRYDLILFSELLYYLTALEIDAMAVLVARDARAGAECVLVHYQGDTETDIRPDDARDRFCAVLANLRKVRLIDHDGPSDYNHRTVICLNAADRQIPLKKAR